MGKRSIALGYDYAEGPVGVFLKPMDDEAAFATVLEEVQDADISVPVLNCFMPGSIKVVGPDFDTGQQDAYVTTVVQRAARMGAEYIVFGSGGARNVPEGFLRESAWEQLVDFMTRAGQLAAKAGVVLVIEPLNTGECNLINSVAEGAQLVEAVNLPSVQLLVDAYHMLREGEPFEAITPHVHLIKHAHLATNANRMAPGAEAEDFSGFFAALKEGGYKGRVSIEAPKLSDAFVELGAA